jgi:hypothetical protein
MPACRADRELACPDSYRDYSSHRRKYFTRSFHTLVFAKIKANDKTSAFVFVYFFFRPRFVFGSGASSMIFLQSSSESSSAFTFFGIL